MASKTHNPPFVRFVRQVSNGQSRPKSAFLSMMADNELRLRSAEWTRANVTTSSTTTNAVTATDGVWDSAVGEWSTPPTYAKYIDDRYDAFLQGGDGVVSTATMCGYAGIAAYRFKLPSAWTATTVETVEIPVSVDKYLRSGVRVSLVFSNAETPSNDWDVIRGVSATCWKTESAASEQEGVSSFGFLGKTASPYLTASIVEYGTISVAVGDIPSLVGAKPAYMWLYLTPEDFAGRWTMYSKKATRNYGIEGSAVIVGDGVAVTFADPVEADHDDPQETHEFNVCRGGVLPALSSEVTGIQTVDVAFNGDPAGEVTPIHVGGPIDDRTAVGLRTAYGKFYRGETQQLQASDYQLKRSERPGASFSVSTGYLDGMSVGAGLMLSAEFEPTGQTTGVWVSLAYGDGVLVAGSGRDDDAGIFYSTDGGQTWTQSNQTTGSWNSLAYGDGVFVAVSGSDAVGIIYSTDGGQTWTQSGQTTGLWRSIAYGGGVFVAGSGSDAVGIIYSTDGGQTWTQSGQTTGSWNSLAYGDGVFVAGNNIDAGIIYSTDGGQTWSQSSQTNGRFRSLAYGGGVFVASGGSVILMCAYSTDGGKTWSASNIIEDSVSSSFAYCHGMFISNDGYYSSDGAKTWRRRVLPSDGLYSLTYADGFLFCGSENGIMRLRPDAYRNLSTEVVSSDNGSGACQALAYGNGVFVAGFGNGIWHSKSSGKTWAQSGQTTGDWQSLAYGGGVFVAGSGSTLVKGIIYSTDGGQTWTQSGQTTGLWRSIAYGGGVFVAGSGSDAVGIIYSTDGGQTWTQSGQTTGKWNSLAYGDGVFVAGSDSDGIIYSTDGGKTWTKSGQTTGLWRSIAYGGGVFVAGSGNAGIWYSTDGGQTWTQSGQKTWFLTALAYGNGVFVAGSGSDAGFQYSIDGGKTWSRGGVETGSWRSLAYGNGVFAAGSGDNAGIHIFDAPNVKLAAAYWRIVSSVLFVRTSVPIDFEATKVRLDWAEWTGKATDGAKFNVWVKRGEFAADYKSDVVNNSMIYTAREKTVAGYELVGVIDATSVQRTATLDLPNVLTGDTATFLLSAFVSADRLNPSGSLSVPFGVSCQRVDTISKTVLGMSTGWKPDITLLG